MSTINVFQISLEIWGIALSLVLAFFSSATAYRVGGVLKSAWTLLLLNCMLLSCDALAYVYDGDPSFIGIILTRFSNFGVFFLEGVLAWGFTCVVQRIITTKKKPSIKSTPMVIAFACVMIQLLGTILTPFMHLYYSFNAQNCYVRESGVILSFLLLGIVVAINIFEIIKGKSQFSEWIRGTFIGMASIIVLSILIQLIFYGISLINITITFVIIILFVSLLTDNREQEFMHHIRGMEDIIKELSRNQSKEDSQ